MTAKSETVDSTGFNSPGPNKSEPTQSSCENNQTEDKEIKCNFSDDKLEPLPENWEKAYTDKGEPYFIDHNSGTSQWLDPRLSKNKKHVSECAEDELPYGWEKIDDPHYGTYYIDHVNKRTQYENPVAQAKQSSSNCLVEKGTVNVLPEENDNSSNERLNLIEKKMNPSGNVVETSYGTRSDTLSQTSTNKAETSEVLVESHSSGVNHNPHRPPYVFTRNPLELIGKIIRTCLVKSSRGFGFTIVGGDDGDIEEFLQIKAVVPNGPAWQDGKLKTGDVLVYINDICVLGYSHRDVVSLFRSINPGETVQLEVCQGYPLPFDPDDPKAEIVTTVAVSNAHGAILDHNSLYHNFLGGIDLPDAQTRSAKSMPDLSSKISNLTPRHNSVDLSNSEEQSSSVQDLSHQQPTKPEFLTVEIIKGKAGFGFTIADSVYGQKVKKILDRLRCQHLQEGDILIEINGQNIRGLAHTDVVQILKECPCAEAARITVQRGGLVRVSKMKSADDIGVRSSTNSSHSFTALPNRSDVYPSVVSVMYRSKTPTADLYSSRDKESVHINRPKTPLVDTRYWPKSTVPETEQTETQIYNHISSADSVSLSNRSDTYATRHADYSRHHVSEQCAENSATNRPEFQSHWQTDITPSLRAAYSAASDRTSVNPTWYTTLGKLRDTYWAENNKDLKPSNMSLGRLSDTQHSKSHSHFGYSQVKLPPPVPPHSGMNIDDSYEDSVFLQSNQCQTWHVKNSANCDGSTSINTQEWNSNGTQNYSDRISNNSRNDSHNQSASHYVEITNNGLAFPSDSFDQNFVPMTHSTSNHSSNALHYDSVTCQKHSTSFENEHPSPVSTLSKCDKAYSNNLPFYNQQGLRPPHLGGVQNAVEMTVTLLRQENGFGFRIVGGTEEGSQVSIGHIVPGGAADLDGRLHTGDEIVSVDSQIVLNTSHHRVVQLMGNAASNGKVTLGVIHRISSIDSAYHTRSTESIYPYDVSVSRRENEGFGFVIISSVSRAGSTIGRIIDGSPADRCGQLHIGDRVLAVNGMNILNMHHGDIVNLIKNSGYSVTLTVGPPQDDTSSTNSASQRAEEQLLEADDQYHAVELHRGTRGFGFSIRGGREFQNMPLYVLRIAENGPADQDGKLLVGDQIIEINSINTKNMTHAEAIELIRQGGSSVRLLVKRTNHMPSAITDNPSPCSGPILYPPSYRPGLPSNEHLTRKKLV